MCSFYSFYPYKLHDIQVCFFPLFLYVHIPNFFTNNNLTCSPFSQISCLWNKSFKKEKIYSEIRSLTDVRREFEIATSCENHSGKVLPEKTKRFDFSSGNFCSYLLKFHDVQCVIRYPWSEDPNGIWFFRYWFRIEHSIRWRIITNILENMHQTKTWE